jgi:hypothetical protein
MQSGLCIALIGGGRWARVHAGVLRSLYPRIKRLLVVSRHNRGAIELNVVSTGATVVIVDTIEDAVRWAPDASVICTASVNHARDALVVLDRNVPALVEKPLALTMPNAAELVAVAQRRGLPLFLCLPLLMATYLRRFKAACGPRIISSMWLGWFDVDVETRDGGDVKRTDITTHKVDEITPHLWSLIDILLGARHATILSTAVRGPDQVSLTLTCDHARVEASFGRRAPTRVRQAKLSFADGGSAELDFAHEPGLATIDGKPCPDDGSWESNPRPLARVYGDFLDGLSDPTKAMQSPILASRCIGSVRLADDVRRRVICHEAERAAALLRSGQRVGDDAELFHLIVDNLGPEFARLGLWIGRSDEPQHRRLAEAAQFCVLRRAGLPSPSEVPAPDDHSAGLATSHFIGQMLDHLTTREP